MMDMEAEKREKTPDFFFDSEVRSPEETTGVAEKFSRVLQPGDVVAFFGELGSGKTFFIKALCRSLGCRQEAKSPSFTIINEYHTTADWMIYHFDFYRLENEMELQNLGLDEFFYNDYLCLVEWADKIEPYLPSRRWEVFLKFVPHQPERRIITIRKRIDDEK